MTNNERFNAALNSCQNPRAVYMARMALQRVMESQEATPAEILEAERLLVEIGK